MKPFVIILFLLSHISFAQITTNFQVVDPNALKLTQQNINRLIGTWNLSHSFELFNGNDYFTERGYLLDFTKNFEIVKNNCKGCHGSQIGNFSFVDDYRIEIAAQSEEHFINGTWVIHELTDSTLHLIKIFTSTGNWKRVHHFSKDTTDFIANDLSENCCNCRFNVAGAWCWGVNFRGAEERWFMLTDYLKQNKTAKVSFKEIEDKIEWLLINAPCLDILLYETALGYYRESLPSLCKKKKKHIRQRIKAIEAQRHEYFGSSFKEKP